MDLFQRRISHGAGIVAVVRPLLRADAQTQRGRQPPEFHGSPLYGKRAGFEWANRPSPSRSARPNLTRAYLVLTDFSTASGSV